MIPGLGLGQNKVALLPDLHFNTRRQLGTQWRQLKHASGNVAGQHVTVVNCRVEADSADFNNG
jgi:hypothetical protein